MDGIDELNQKWQELWYWRSISTASKYPLARQEINRTFQLLVTAYTQPDRHYHNLEHLHHILTMLERFANRLQQPSLVLIAAWFHDFVYDPQSAENESQSAKLAGELLQNIGESMGSVDRIQQLILATKGHQIDIRDNDLCIFLDADLAIFGTNPDRYQAYARSIRREYSWVADELYRAGRIRVLESFLHRDRLYHTDLLFKELEPVARLNLQQELLSLKNADSLVG